MTININKSGFVASSKATLSLIKLPQGLFTYPNLSGYFPLSDRVTACPDRPAIKTWTSNGSPTPMRQAIAHSATLTLLRSSSRVSQTTLRHRSSIHLLALAMKLILLPPCLRIHNPWRLRPLVLLVHGPLPATEI